MYVTKKKKKKKECDYTILNVACSFRTKKNNQTSINCSFEKCVQSRGRTIHMIADQSSVIDIKQSASRDD